jgi:hypothetical protein
MKEAADMTTWTAREESSRFPDLRLSSLQTKKLELGEGGKPVREERREGG